MEYSHYGSVIVGATLACGTGACATVVAAVLEGNAGRVSFRLEV
jgi:diaminopimelate epimerase